MATPLLKRFVCCACGATGPMPHDTPFVTCRSCGVIGDFDLGIARRHPDWPRHEALQHALYAQRKDALARAVSAADHEAYVSLQSEITGALMKECPAVYPGRLQRDPSYRAHWIRFQATHSANLVLDPTLLACGRTTAEIGARVLRQQPWTTATLWPMFEAAVRHFEAQDRLCRERPPGPPPDFAPGYMRRLGVSMTVQEWLPRLEPADQLELVARMGIAHEYVTPAERSRSHCGGCGAVLAAASTLAPSSTEPERCPGCTKAIERARGAFDCVSCGVVVHLVVGSEVATCPFCSSEMRESRMGLEARERSRRLFGFIDSELAALGERFSRDAVRIEVLDGTVTRRDLPWRMSTLRAVFRDGPDADFFENTDHPDAPSHDDVLAWVEVQLQVRALPHRTRRYREDPRCLTRPSGVAELERRLLDAGADAVATVRVVKRGPNGWACEAEVGDEVVRLFTDDEGEHHDLRRSWPRTSTLRW